MARKSDCPGTRLRRGRRRPGLLILLAALAILAALLLGVTVADATAPAVTVEDASSVAYTTAQVEGTVDPGGESTTWRFQYISEARFQENLTNSLPGFEGAATGLEGTLEGTGAQPVPPNAGEELTNLAPNTTWHLRLIAENGSGPAEATAASSFTTEAVAAPTVTIEEARQVSYTSAEAEGTVELAGTDPAFDASCAFQYLSEAQFQENLTNSLPGFENANSVSCEPETVTGTGTQTVKAPLAGLHPNATWHLRLVASNAGGTETAVAASTFTTKAVVAPTVSVDPVEGNTITGTTATFVAHIDPDAPEAAPATPAVEAGFAVHWRFQCTPECPGLEGTVAADDTSHQETVQAGGLLPSTGYTVELIAENSGGEETRATSAPVTFTTTAAPPIVGQPSVSQVNSTTATLHGQVNPQGAATSWFFEYGPTEAYGQQTPVSGPLASSDEGQAVSAQLTGLEPATTYHYRLVATNPVETTMTTDATFHTFPASAEGADGCPNATSRFGPSANLPDCRAFEMVTPVENEGADVYVPNAVPEGILNSGRVGTSTYLPFQAATDGDAVAYIGDPTVGGNGNAGVALGDQYLATRDPEGGWTQQNVEPGDGNLFAYYQAFSEDLSLGIVSSGTPLAPSLAPLSPQAPGGGYPDLYSHDLRSGGYLPFVTSVPSESAEEFRTYGVPSVQAKVGLNYLIYAGASRDRTQELFEAPGSLIPGAPSGPEANDLYDFHGGELDLVNVLPGGAIEPNATFGGPRLPVRKGFPESPDFDHVISEDGSRVYWTDLNPGPDAGHIYLRLNPTEAQSALNGEECEEPEKACTVPVSEGEARYWTATPDGRYAFYTEEGRLFRYDAQTNTREALTPAGKGVQGVIGTSEDGSKIYIVAAGVLVPNPSTEKNSEGVEAVEGEGSIEEEEVEEPESGFFNLYLFEEGQGMRFVARLSQEDAEHTTQQVPGKGHLGDLQPEVGHRTAQVTPSGGDLVFVSRDQPGGPGSELEGRGLTEVYRYDAKANRISCLSCNPAGELPESNSESQKTIGGFLAPDWSFVTPPRWMSRSGSRVFFDSSQPLVPADTNGTQDVYEWESQATGSCHAAEAVEGGCVYLLSGGTGEAGSSLIGIDAEGENAFIVSRNHLVPEDSNEAFNLFDARVGGVQPTPPPPCEGEGCQAKPQATPAYTAPATGSFHGPGDPAAPRCRKGQRRRHGKCVKDEGRSHHKGHRKKPHKHKRNHTKSGLAGAGRGGAK